MVLKKKRSSVKEISTTPSRRPLPLLRDQDDISNLSTMSLKKRQQIVEAAIDCFLELGYQGTSMNAVAERAGVIKQTIYSHFENKETLFKRVIGSLTLDYLRDQIDSPQMSGKTARDVLLKFAQTILERHRDPQFIKFFRTMIGEVGRFPELARLFTEATIKPGLEIVATQLRRSDEFEIPDPEAFARVFIGTLVHYSMQQQVLGGVEFFPFDRARILTELMRLLDLHATGKKA